MCQGAPRTCRCIETPRDSSERGVSMCQGAPRTCRCIETWNDGTLISDTTVREHHAPVGALRPSYDYCFVVG